jgi:carbamoyltransferase
VGRVGRDRTIEIEGREALTQFLGFPHYGDEYKAMGLAPHGKPIYLPEMRKIVRLLDDGVFELDTTYFRHQTQCVFSPAAVCGRSNERNG